MIFKPLSNFSRHAALAKHLWVQSGGHNHQSQPSFFLTTNQLARQQSQLSIRTGNDFGNNEDGSGGGSTTTASYASICSSTLFPTISPLSSLDDERQRELVAESIGHNNGGYMMYNHQRSLVKPVPTEFHRRYSVSTSRDEVKELKDVEAESRPVEQEIVNEKEVKVEVEELTNASASEEEVNIYQSTPKSNSLPESSTSPATPPTSISSSVEQNFSDSKPLSIIPPGTPSTSLGDEKISSAFSTGDYERVVELYRTSFPSQSLSIHAFNKVLISMANICSENSGSDLTPLLDAYTTLLSTKSILPNVHTYSILITTLLDNSSKSQESSNLLNLRNVKSRHTKLLPSVSEELSKNDEISTMYSDLALELFEASNSVKLQNYSTSIYLQLLDACITFNKFDKLDKIVQCMRSSSISSPEIDISLIKAYGLSHNLESASKIFDANKSTFSPSLYSAMISANFNCNEPAAAAELLQTILNDKSNSSIVQSEQFGEILVQVFQGFAKSGQCEDSWRWIQQAESDSSICPISLDNLIKTFSTICQTEINDKEQLNIAHQMFDFMAAYKASSKSDLFNDARCDYIMLCVSKRDNPSLYKAINETHVRGGVWDETTLVKVAQYLINIDQVELALDVFQMQSSRIKKYLADRNLSEVSSYSSFGEEALSIVVSQLKSQNLLTIDNVLSIANSGFMTSRVFANSNGGGVDIMQAIWSERAKFNGEVSMYSSSKSLALDILRLHCTWIQSSTQSSSLGNLSIPTEVVQELKKNFSIFIQDVISQRLPVSNLLHEDVESSLQLLDDYSTVELWNKYFNESQKVLSPEPQLFIEEPTSEPFTLVNLETSAEIIGYAKTENGVLQALNILRDTLIRKELVTPNAILFLLEGASTAKLPGTNEIFHEVYSLCLQYLPPPSMAPQAWDAWTSIHRSIVTHSAEIDYSLAESAYVNLLEMGSCPDATGYGQLMAHAPTNNNRDEAVDAMRMFNEARTSGIPLNTFLYNVLLSKLSKARKLKEAAAIFNEMDRYNIKKSNVTYGTMISACCRAGDGDFAMKLFNEMETSSSYVPKVAPFNIMLQYFVHTKQDREASLKVYGKLRELGLSPSAHTYKLLIDMYSTINPIDMKSADNILLTIKKDGNEITSQHFAALLFSRGVVQNDLAAAQEFYNVLVHEKKIRPDKVIFQALLESYVVNDKVRETTKVLQEMVSYGINLNAYMANILIRGWGSISIDKSVGLFDYILQANIAEPSSYESIIRAFIYHGDFISTDNVLDLMRTNRYPEAVVQKVDLLVRQGHNNELARDRILLDSIFRHDAHRLNSISSV